jgi:hypothetical protein
MDALQSGFDEQLTALKAAYKDCNVTLTEKNASAAARGLDTNTTVPKAADTNGSNTVIKNDVNSSADLNKTQTVETNSSRP